MFLYGMSVSFIVILGLFRVYKFYLLYRSTEVRIFIHGEEDLKELDIWTYRAQVVYVLRKVKNAGNNNRKFCCFIVFVSPYTILYDTRALLIKLKHFSAFLEELINNVK